MALDTAARSSIISKLALYEPSFVVDDSRPPLPKDYVEHLNKLIQAGQRGDAIEYAMVNAVLIPHEMVAGMRQSPVWSTLEAVAHTIAYDGAFVANLMQGNALPAEQWQQVMQPSLVMAGSESPTWLTNAAQTLAQTLHDAKHQVLEGQLHDVKPEILAPVLLQFFND